METYISRGHQTIEKEKCIMIDNKQKFEFIRNLYLTLTVLNIKNKYSFNVPIGYKDEKNLNTFVEMFDNCYIMDGNSRKYDILYLLNILINRGLVVNSSKTYYTKYRQIIADGVKNRTIKKTTINS